MRLEIKRPQIAELLLKLLFNVLIQINLEFTGEPSILNLQVTVQKQENHVKRAS